MSVVSKKGYLLDNIDRFMFEWSEVFINDVFEERRNTSASCTLFDMIRCLAHHEREQYIALALLGLLHIVVDIK